MFENPQISQDDLPQAGSVDWLAMDEKYLRRLLTQAAIAVIFVTLGIGSLQIVFSVAFADYNLDVSFGWLWLLVPLLAIPLFVWPLISVPRKGYAVRANDIVYKSDLLPACMAMAVLSSSLGWRAIWVLLWIPVALFGVWRVYRRYGVFVSEDGLALRKGLFGYRVTALPANQGDHAPRKSRFNN